MTKYRVNVRRIVREDIDIEVEAENEEAAKIEAQALSTGPEKNWDVYDCEYWFDDDAVKTVEA